MLKSPISCLSMASTASMMTMSVSVSLEVSYRMSCFPNRLHSGHFASRPQSQVSGRPVVPSFIPDDMAPFFSHNCRWVTVLPFINYVRTAESSYGGVSEWSSEGTKRQPFIHWQDLHPRTIIHPGLLSSTLSNKILFQSLTHTLSSQSQAAAIGRKNVARGKNVAASGIASNGWSGGPACRERESPALYFLASAD